MTFYLKDLAADFHSYYNAERFLIDDVPHRRARLLLAAAAGPGRAQRPRGAGHRRSGDRCDRKFPCGRETATLDLAMTRARVFAILPRRTPRPRARHAADRAWAARWSASSSGIAVGLGLAAAVAFYVMRAGNPYQPAVSANAREPVKEASKGSRAERR